MSLTYPLTFPSGIGISQFSLRMVKSVAVAESPFTYNQQVHDFGGARWEAEITVPPLTQSNAQLFQAFLIGLEGRKGTFTMGHPLHNASGTVTADAASKGDTRISLDGSAMTAGTYFSISNRLYMATEAKASGSDVFVEIQPPLRNAISQGAGCDLTLPKGLWRLSTNEVAWSTDTSATTPFTFACVEAI